MTARRAFLIDGTAFCYRAFHAVRRLSTADGRPTNAVYGFAVMLQALRDQEHPDYLGVAFDVGKPTFRHERFEAYKAHRKPMPEPLIAQLPLVKRLLAASRVPVFECEGYEAEDVLATIARRIAQPDLEVYLVTGDKDALQLVNSHLKVYNPHQDPRVVDADAVKARYGVVPERMVDLMALMGDKTDNIPGVTGIGEKTAAELLGRYGSLERLYEGLETLESAAQRERLRAGREQAMLSRELARIREDAPVTVSLEELKAPVPDWPALRQLYRDLEFRRLAAGTETPAGPAPSARVHWAAEAGELARALRGLGAGPVAVAIWWVRDDHTEALLAAAAGPDEAWLGRIDAKTLTPGSGNDLAAWLRDEAVAKVGHDVKALRRLLLSCGADLAGVTGDTMVAAHLLNPARTQPLLSELADEFLGQPLGALPTLQPVVAEDAALQGALAAATCTTWRLHDVLLRQLDARQQRSLYETLEVPLIGILTEMEETGIALDLAALELLRARMSARLVDLTQDIYRLAGTSFNLNSPRQLGQVLFDRLKLPVIKRGKTGPSTDSSVLQHLARQHPLPQRLLEYRELAKLVSTYVEALPRLVNPATGRVHTSWNQTATATGRLSSSDPNLQNIPIKTELGRSIRAAFVSGGPDRMLVSADYSQIELRILAHLSEDPRLCRAFAEGRDIHRYTASLIYGLPEPEVGPEQRSAMKAVNFGILYGMTAHGLSQELGIPPQDAEAFIAAYFERYPAVRGYQEAQIAKARSAGYVETLLGRRRYVPEVNSPDGVLRQVGERMAINAPVQGTAADLIKQAMLRLSRALRKHGLASRLVLQVHDELVLDVPRGEVPQLVPLLREAMEQAVTLRVPLTVTVKAGVNWLEMAETTPS